MVGDVESLLKVANNEHSLISLDLQVKTTLSWVWRVWLRQGVTYHRSKDTLWAHVGTLIFRRERCWSTDKRSLTFCTKVIKHNHLGAWSRSRDIQWWSPFIKECNEVRIHFWYCGNVHRAGTHSRSIGLWVSCGEEWGRSLNSQLCHLWRGPEATKTASSDHAYPRQ